MKLIKSLTAFCLALMACCFISCKKTFDLPPARTVPADNGSISIDSVIRKYGSYYITAFPGPSKLFKFSNDVSITCTVTADENSGNIYKTVFVQDATGSLQVKLLNSGGLYVGDLIRINLNNVILDDYGKQIQLDSLDIDKHVVKISSGNPVYPTKMTFSQLQQQNSFGLLKYQSRLVLIDSVEFSDIDKNSPFADPVGKYSLDKILYNSADNSVIVRTSGYSKFAGSLIPCGKGSLVAVLGQYNSDVQLTIRDYNEVKLSQGNCPIYITKFNDLVGWTNYNETGSINWKIGTFSGENYAEASNYSGGNSLCKTWLISPSLNITSAPNPKLRFTSAYNYSGDALEVYVSTNYTSGNPTLATWVKLNPVLSPGGWAWTSSGKISLSTYKSNNTRIAFVYKGTASDGSTWEVDNFALLAE